ncbi:Protein of unknown function [Devosia sp. YR412]|uniref:DUF2934 domain-containing protein n=1 Tax=Devosia sp. YR412 TaxID=1881030 RepID=UPI0008D08570|nr:DUF2934 domain-containing protein [Devosia sp. YR412]SEQ11681.1 Protein of unknown function [Devosia sp. YR412]
MDINENSIRERAHWLWKQAGSPEGQDLEFWLEAERSLAAEGDDSSLIEAEDHGQANPNARSPTSWGQS